MHVFLCWSGPKSHAIAEALHVFLGDTIQELKPFLSSEDIRKGDRWRSEISQRLSDCNFGILCLTKENLVAPWILFEAGALAKNMLSGRVTALLAGIKATDVIEPLSQFQQTRMDKADILQLLRDVNKLIDEPQRLPQDRLERLFTTNWPLLDAKITTAMKLEAPQGSATPPRDVEDMVAELLALVREMKRETEPKGQRGPSSFVYGTGPGASLNELMRSGMPLPNTPLTPK